MDIQSYYVLPGEKPLDRIRDDGGFCGIFRTICCIGDSLSSGEFQTVDALGTNHYYDFYEYSWGQYLARMTGSTVWNCSRGGMTAQEYWDSFSVENRCWDAHKISQAYILALGVNDFSWAGYEVGQWQDAFREPTSDKDCFACYYGKILKKIRQQSPGSKLFLVTMPRETSDEPEYAEKKRQHKQLLHGIAQAMTDTWVIDLHRYAPIYDAEFKRNFYFNGHMNAQGYLLTAKIIGSYVDYIIRSSPEAFQNTPFLGTGIHT